MKVLFIGRVPLDLKSVRGGIESANLNLLEGFISLPNISVEMIVFNKDINKVIKRNLSKDIKITYYPIKFKKIELLNILFSEKNIIKRKYMSFKPNIIHYQGSGPHLLSVIGINRKITIVTMHGLLVKELLYQYGIYMKFRVMTRAMFDTILLKFFKNFIFISKYNKNEIVKSKNVKYSIIPNTVSSTFINSFSIKSNKKLLFVGAISKLKNLTLLFDAMYELKTIGIVYYLTIIGDFKSTYYKSYLYEYIKGLQIENQIVFQGWIDQLRLIEYYDDASIVILPSRQENLPVCLIEAMARGKTVIASDVGGVSELIDDKITGFLFQDNNKEELTNILSVLHNNSELINDIGEKAHYKIKNEFNTAIIARRTKQFYERIANRK